MTLSSDQARRQVEDVLLPMLIQQRAQMDRLDRWYRWEHEPPHKPRQASAEYRELMTRAQTPWLGLVVTAVAQSLYVEGYRSAAHSDNAAPWGIWQANGMDARQIAVHRAALAYGQSYVTVLPGLTPNGELMPVLRGVSPRRMLTVYDDPAEDEWPALALRGDPVMLKDGQGWRLRLYDDVNRYDLTANAEGKVEFLRLAEHGADTCPVIRFANQLDLEGRTPGEVEPYISVAARVDQTAFDRLVVQRFASWIVRTIAGMAKPEAAEDAEAEKLRLRAEDILIADDPDTKFGSLPATPLNGFIDAADKDIRDLAAVTQTPPHHLLGQMANLSAEALAAAEAGLTRKVHERKTLFGESWEQALRLAAGLAGDNASAADFAAQVRWADLESRSLAQVADALGKLATMLGVPPQVLWEKIPGWTDQDVARAKAVAEETGGLEALMRELAGGNNTTPTDQPALTG